MAQRSQFRKLVHLRPVEHMYDISKASFNQPNAYAAWPSMNCMIGDQASVVPRPGYTTDIAMNPDERVLNVARFQKRDGTAYTIYLTEHDIAIRSLVAGETYAYHTPLWMAGTVTTSDALKVITGDAAVNWDTVYTGSGVKPVKVGDKFITNLDFAERYNEPYTKWRTISTIDSDTQVTLTANAYANQPAGSAYRIRQLYAVPAGERWSHCMCANQFIFTCGGTHVQTWGGDITAVATSLSSEKGLLVGTATYATNARYCLAYADRLLIADMYIGGSRQPWSLYWSKQDYPETWLDTTAGNQSFIETEGFITGLGIVGTDMVIYKNRSMIFGYRTGIGATPFEFTMERRGIGCWAPYSLVHAMSTNFFLGADDFYIINGDHPESIGKKIRGKFFSMVPVGEREKVFGWWSRDKHMVIWVANTTNYGQVFFGYDYINMEWMTWKYHMEVTGAGEAA